MPGPFVHRIDPILFSLGGLHAWWYGLSYTLGFLNAFLFIRRHRGALGLSTRAVYDFALLLAGGVLVGGRVLSVFHDRALYVDHPEWLPAVWMGGMATHGLIVGGFAGVLVFCLVHRRPYRAVFDVLAMPAALILGLGRIGNFIDGQIVGSETDVWWAVKFPEADGYRHPVVLYDGAKNLLLIPLLWWVRRRGAPPGRLAALFVFLYAALRIPIDLWREYPADLLGLPAGQLFNVLMAAVGLALLLRNWLRRRPIVVPIPPAPAGGGRVPGLAWRRALLAALLAGSLVIPSDAPRDVPEVYGHRHPGLTHSWWYPPVISGATPDMR